MCNSAGTYTVEYWVLSKVMQNTSDRTLKKKKSSLSCIIKQNINKNTTVLRGWHCKDNKDSVHIEVLECVFKSLVYKSQEVRIDFWYFSFLDRLKLTLKCICIFPSASAPPLCFQFIRRQKAEMSIYEKFFSTKLELKKKSFLLRQMFCL